MIDNQVHQVSMMKIEKRLLALLFAALLMLPLAATAMSLNQAVAKVRAENDVKQVLVAETRNVKGREMHVIRILTNDGRVRQIRIPVR